MWCDVMCVPSRLEETCQNFRLCWFALSCKVVLKYVFCAFSLSEKLVGSLLMCKWRVRQYTDVLYKLLLVDFSRLRKQMAFGIVGSKRAFFVRQQEVHQWFKKFVDWRAIDRKKARRRIFDCWISNEAPYTGEDLIFARWGYASLSGPSVFAVPS